MVRAAPGARHENEPSREPLRRTVHLICLLFVVRCCRPFAARAQLTIEIVGGAGTTVRIASFRSRNGELAARDHRHRRRGSPSVAACSAGRRGRHRAPDPARAEDVNSATIAPRGADAVVVGSMRPLGDGESRCASHSSMR